jgi:hypothetical protein
MHFQIATPVESTLLPLHSEIFLNQNLKRFGGDCLVLAQAVSERLLKLRTSMIEF